MKNEICLSKIIVMENVLRYEFELKGEWQRFFSSNRMIQIEYTESVDNVPESILVVPFVGNILPIAWLCNARIIINTIDKMFYECVNDIRLGYQEMYPMLNFHECHITATLEENLLQSNDARKACFFSGGMDAFTTLFRHLDEMPYLFTIWGADVKLSDEEGWENVNAHIESVARQFSLKYISAKSDFRDIYKQLELDRFVSKSGDGWWHGFHSSIAILTHLAPIAYNNSLDCAYIASSFPAYMKGKYTCASDPLTDNNVRFCGCQIHHDAYEWDRQDKARYLVRKKKDLNQKVNLRVCWESTGGKNCCACEKCYRTILEIVSEGDDPNEYGFEWDVPHIKQCERDMKYKITSAQFNVDQFYPKIQKAMLANKDTIMNFEHYDWFISYDFSKFNDSIVKRFRKSLVYRAYRKACRMLCFHGKISK